MEDRAMLGSNLSAVAGDGDMEGGIQSNVCCPHLGLPLMTCYWHAETEKPPSNK